jgi:hypothetical protein
MNEQEKVIGIHQPNFIPWAGYFNKIYRSDTFVIIDDVQFAKGSVCNRTKIKNNVGEAVWLTVPVSFLNGSASTFNETIIADSTWYRKSLNLIKASYIQSPYFSQVYPEVEEILKGEYASLAKLNIAFIRYFCHKLNIQTPLHIQSELDAEFGKKNDLNLGITQYFEGNIYLSGNGAKKYNDEVLFEKNRIKIQYLNFVAPHYRQINGAFIENLSVLDLLFNEGENSEAFVKAVQN